MTQRKAQEHRTHLDSICEILQCDSPLVAHVNIDFFAKMIDMTTEDAKECFDLSPDCQGVSYVPDVMGGIVTDEW